MLFFCGIYAPERGGKDVARLGERKLTGKEKKKGAAVGLACGFLNGLFGAGGGVAAVFFLKKLGLPTKNAHATSLAILLPLSLVTSALYWWQGAYEPGEVLPYLPGAVLGAVGGGLLMGRIPQRLLRFIFAGLLLFSSCRLLFFS